MRSSAPLAARRAPRPYRALLVSALAAACIGGCGAASPGGSGATAPTSGSVAAGTAAAKPSPHHHTPGMVMGGGPRGASSGPAATAAAPTAVDARRVAGRTLLSGTFVPAPAAPAGVTGSGWLAHGQGGTTVTVEVSGLPAGAWYMVHLGTRPCADGDDSTYTFPAAAGRPAHPLHVMFSPTAGRTTVTQEDAADVAGAVRSLVLLPESMQGRMACADLA